MTGATGHQYGRVFLGLIQSYRMRLIRRRLRLRAAIKRRELTPVKNRTHRMAPGDILGFATLRNEIVRLPWFLDHYRRLGVRHFLFVDNDSTDGSLAYLEAQEDVSLWHTRASYKRSRFGMDWMNWLLGRFGHGHWCLTVDPDELLVYPFCETRPLSALTDWLDASDTRSFGAMLLDLYPKGPLDKAVCLPGQNPLEVANCFDAGNYRIDRNPMYGNLWIQGGPRERLFFADRPREAPALNKIPLVKWHRRYAYVSSTHALLPRGLNLTYDRSGGEKTCGVLLHTKFLNTFSDKAAEELDRRQHYGNSREYIAYAEGISASPALWHAFSETYLNWRQLEGLGLMSRGTWA